MKATVHSEAHNVSLQELEQIFQRHYQLVYRPAYGVTGSVEDAEDILQTIFLRLLAREFPPDLRKNPEPYLYKAAFNLSLNTIRHRKRCVLTDDVRLNYRQRFSIFNVSANYVRALIWSDSIHSALVAQNFPNGIQYGLPEGIPADSYNLRADWALAALPVKHTLTSAVNAQLPLGVFLTGTMNATSGRLYTVLTGTDDNKDNSINDRPIDEPRNGASGPPALTFDFNISKAFFFGTAGTGNGAVRTNINVFANMTNAFNRPNYNPPSGVMTSPNFGRSTSAGNPREIEVVVRFQF